MSEAQPHLQQAEELLELVELLPHTPDHIGRFLIDVFSCHTSGYRDLNPVHLLGRQVCYQ